MKELKEREKSRKRDESIIKRQNRIKERLIRADEAKSKIKEF